MSKETKRVGAHNFLKKIASWLTPNAILNEKIEHVGNATSLEDITDICQREFPDICKAPQERDLRILLKESLTAKNSIEEKAKALVITSTIATTLCVGLYEVVSNLFASCPSILLRAFVAVLSIISVGAMIVAACKSIGIFTKKIRVHVIDEGATDKVLELAKCTMANRWENIIRSNDLSDAFSSLRFSLFMLFILFSIIVIVA